jgi:hypothetical protein
MGKKLSFSPNIRFYISWATPSFLTHQLVFDPKARSHQFWCRIHKMVN